MRRNDNHLRAIKIALGFAGIAVAAVYKRHPEAALPLGIVVASVTLICVIVYFIPRENDSEAEQRNGLRENARGNGDIPQ